MLKLADEIDVKQLARDAEISVKTSEDIARRMEGRSRKTDPIALARDPYTALQTAFEEALMSIFEGSPEVAFPDPEDHQRPPFLYRTPKLATPIHNTGHSRADVVEDMVRGIIPPGTKDAGEDQRVPLAIFLCNLKSLKAIKALKHMGTAAVRERLERLLRAGREVDPFSWNHIGAETAHTFMAMRPTGGLQAVQFEASQMPDLDNDTPGRLIIGNEAVAAYERGLIRHRDNQAGNRKSAMILSTLLAG